MKYPDIIVSMKKNLQKENAWSFAIVNNRLAEIHFETGKGLLGVWGHCCVKRSEYKTKIEQKMIESDIKKFNLIYQNKVYKETV